MSGLESKGRIIILGAGPTGLGAAYRLKLLDYKNWAIYEKEDRIGGLSKSYKDDKGFTWDIGGHVMFSNMDDFTTIVDALLGNDAISHERESWIRMMGRWIPYPFQNNIRHLPREAALQCLMGLIQSQQEKTSVSNFEEWIIQSFGHGIAKHFMLPYNFKVWAFPPSTMAFDWIAERVSLVSIERILKNVIMDIDDTGWGTNKRFKFPRYGGTGGFFNSFEPFVQNNLHCRQIPERIDLETRIIYFNNGKTEHYDTLISTAPLDLFVRLLHSRKEDINMLRDQAGNLAHNSVYVIGFGLKKYMAGTKCWVYFPEEQIPFYRMTYFSHYSPHNVPQGDTATYSSIICEVSFSPYRSVSESEVMASTIQGLFSAGILGENDRDRIVSTWQYKVDHAYPIPTVGRDDALRKIQTVLERNRIHSRGRFGAWKYETGNMDHSVMMGMEVVDRIFFEKPEQVWSL